jgi:hypothetical protein
MSTPVDNINTSFNMLTVLNTLIALNALNSINNTRYNSQYYSIELSSNNEIIMYQIKNNRKLVSNNTTNHSTTKSKKAANASNVTYKPNLKNPTIRYSLLSPRTLRY